MKTLIALILALVVLVVILVMAVVPGLSATDEAAPKWGSYTCNLIAEIYVIWVNPYVVPEIDYPAGYITVSYGNNIDSEELWLYAYDQLTNTVTYKTSYVMPGYLFPNTDRFTYTLSGAVFHDGPGMTFIEPDNFHPACWPRTWLPMMNFDGSNHDPVR